MFCKANEATCHLTKIVNGKTMDIHVCDTCIPELKSPKLDDFDIWEAVSKLAKSQGMPDPTQSVELPPQEEISAKSLLLHQNKDDESQACPACGFTTDDLRRTGRLGCPACYEVFTEMLADVLNDCQKSSQHMGKVPSLMTGLRRQRLEEMLQKAIEKEAFEDAAFLRDQLRALETANV
jgi:protein arginine kinase activator